MKKLNREIVLFLLIFIFTLLVTTKGAFLSDLTGAWNIDNSACVGCGGCATNCVLPQSAVVAVMDQSLCKNLENCPAFFKPQKGKKSNNSDSCSTVREGREFENCPTGAFVRTQLDDGTFRYTINAEKCIGCGKCTRLCQKKGNGALTLVIDHEKCVDCNECQIGKECPTDAVNRKAK